MVELSIMHKMFALHVGADSSMWPTEHTARGIVYVLCRRRSLNSVIMYSISFGHDTQLSLHVLLSLGFCSKLTASEQIFCGVCTVSLLSLHLNAAIPQYCHGSSGWLQLYLVVALCATDI